MPADIDDDFDLQELEAFIRSPAAKRIMADEEAVERLIAFFEERVGSAPRCSIQLLEFGRLFSDDTLIELGFEHRAGFERNLELIITVQHGACAKDALN